MPPIGIGLTVFEAGATNLTMGKCKLDEKEPDRNPTGPEADLDVLSERLDKDGPHSQALMLLIGLGEFWCLAQSYTSGEPAGVRQLDR